MAVGIKGDDDLASGDRAPARPSFAEATRVWLKIGLLGFGGPSAQIALMHRLLVDERRWIGEPQFLHALNFCMLLPGPEAQQLAIYVGWLLHGTRGGLVAGPASGERQDGGGQQGSGARGAAGKGHAGLRLSAGRRSGARSRRTLGTGRFAAGRGAFRDG